MVNASMELIAVRDTGSTRNVVERAVAGSIWRGVILQSRVSNQAEAFLRNDVSRKRTSSVRRRIVRRGVVDNRTTSEIAIALRFGRNAQVQRVCSPSPKTFV